MYSVNHTVNSTHGPGETCPGCQGGPSLLSFNKHIQNCYSIVTVRRNVSTMVFFSGRATLLCGMFCKPRKGVSILAFLAEAFNEIYLWQILEDTCKKNNIFCWFQVKNIYKKKKTLPYILESQKVYLRICFSITSLLP